MFKTNENSEISEKKFGVGSIIDCSSNGKYAVIGTISSTHKCVGLLNLQTFVLEYAPGLRVGDLNFLTESEARQLIDCTIGKTLNWTFTDFDLNAKGMKFSFK